jgi:hypothetical protein
MIALLFDHPALHFGVPAGSHSVALCLCGPGGGQGTEVDVVSNCK